MGFKDFKKVLLSTLLIQAKMTQLNCQRRLKIRNYSLRAIYTKSYTCTSNAKPELLKFMKELGSNFIYLTSRLRQVSHQ